MKLIGNNDDKKYEIGNFSEELNKRAKKIKIAKKRNIENKINFTKKGITHLNLKTLNDFVLCVKTQEIYDTIMQLYECSNWKNSLKSYPTDLNNWNKNREDTILTIKNGFSHYHSSFYMFDYDKVITPELFYAKQSITPEKIKEINNWFEMNKPNRASKGNSKNE